MKKRNQALLKKFARLRTEAAVVRKQEDFADFAFLMRQIADLTLTTDMTMEASVELIKLRFSTAATDYTCWIPACSKDGVRSAVGFSKYAHQLTAETVDDALDDEKPFIP
jgi:hypothetical protein